MTLQPRTRRPPPRNTSSDISSALSCPECGKFRVAVTDSRATLSQTMIRRRRCCHDCWHRWTTYEISGDLIDDILNLTTTLDDLERFSKDIGRVAAKALTAIDALRNVGVETGVELEKLRRSGSESFQWLESLNDVDAGTDRDPAGNGSRAR